MPRKSWLSIWKSFLDAPTDARDAIAGTSELVAWMNGDQSAISIRTKEEMLSGAGHGPEFALAARMAERYSIPLYTHPAHPATPPSPELEQARVAFITIMKMIAEDGEISIQGMESLVEHGPTILRALERADVAALRQDATAWQNLLANCDAVPCKYPCLRDDLHDWKYAYAAALAASEVV